MRDLSDLDAGLPFPLDDTDAAARAFIAGRAGDAAAREHALLWAYGWITRYVARAFVSERISEASDIDAVQSAITTGVFGNLDRVADPALFPNYVMKACKNALVSHRRSRRVFVEADDAVLAPTLDDDRFEGDARIVRRDAEAAIADLPPAIRPVAEMRFLDGAPYDAIAAATGHPLPTVRTYANKALARLLKNPRLRAHYFDDVLPPGADPEDPSG